jgi:Flp pilus assembly protein TadG
VRGSRASSRDDRGAVTVEAALALCTLTVVVALAVAAITAAATSVRCTDAARELVRLAARGEPDRGRAVAARLAPAGARIELEVRGDEATGEVTTTPLRILPVRLTGRAVAVLEPGAVLEPEAGGRAGRPAGGEP